MKITVLYILDFSMNGHFTLQILDEKSDIMIISVFTHTLETVWNKIRLYKPIGTIITYDNFLGWSRNIMRKIVNHNNMTINPRLSGSSTYEIDLITGKYNIVESESDMTTMSYANQENDQKQKQKQKKKKRKGKRKALKSSLTDEEIMIVGNLPL